MGLCIGLGFAFTGNLQVASDFALQVLGFLGAGAAAVGPGTWLVVTLRAERRQEG